MAARKVSKTFGWWFNSTHEHNIKGCESNQGGLITNRDMSSVALINGESVYQNGF